MFERQAPECFKGDSCLDSNGKPLRPCHEKTDLERYVATSPLIPAEQLCLAGLKAHKESRAKSELVDAFASASFDLDRSIAIPRFTLDDEEFGGQDNLQLKRNIFTQVTMTLHGVPPIDTIKNPGHLPIALQLRRLGVFMPAFRTRVDNEPLTPGLIQQTHGGLCQHIEECAELMIRTRDHAQKKRIAAHKAECEVMALLTRLGEPKHFPYVALLREEASHARKQHNHDFYTLPKPKKRPVQVKTSSQGTGYSNEITVIKHYDILRSLKRDPETHVISWSPTSTHEDFEWPNPYRYEQVLTGEAPNPLAELLHDEQKYGKKLNRSKQNALSLASSYVLSRIV